MVLDLGKGGLFGSRGLEQETGLLKERWGQDGSSVVNVTVFIDASPTSLTLHTVTTGKRLFINYIKVNDSAAFNGLIRDGGGAGTLKFTYRGPANGEVTCTLPTPIYFDTDAYVEFSATNGYITISGWEEPLA